VIVVGAVGDRRRQATRQSSRHADTLVDRHDHHQFQPLLCQVATTSQLASSDIAFSLRKLFRDNGSV
jgi:NADH dehydrogenase